MGDKIQEGLNISENEDREFEIELTELINKYFYDKKCKMPGMLISSFIKMVINGLSIVMNAKFNLDIDNTKTFEGQVNCQNCEYKLVFADCKPCKDCFYNKIKDLKGEKNNWKLK